MPALGSEFMRHECCGQRGAKKGGSAGR